MLEQADFADVGEAGKLKCPCHRGDCLGYTNAKVADCHHVVAGPERKGVALEEQIVRFFRTSIPRHRTVVSVKTQHTLLGGFERIQRSEVLELYPVDDPLDAVEGELVADLVRRKLNVALDAARVVVHHRAAGFQRHVAPRIDRHLRRRVALAVVEVKTDLALGDVTKRGQRGVVLELDRRQLAIVAVQNHRVTDFPR